MGIFSRINKGLKKTRENMSGAIDSMLHGKTEIDDEFYDELEEILVMGDVGCMTASEIVEKLRERVMKKHLRKPEAVKNEIKEIVAEMLEGGEEMSLITLPSVILVIGVNGVGKTTSIGKLAAMYKNEGKKVILAAADTFRAAAIEQLEEWADRAGVEIVKHREGADPAAVIYDTIQAGKARNADIIICDTAGRLHNKKNLMEELAKIYRVIDRELPYSDRESLLVLDATTGQNAVNQAKEFKNVAEITGIILTKLDGTAKGGVVLNIKNELGVPVKFIGVGEQIVITRPNLFGPLPQELCDIVYPSLAYRLMAHSAEDLCEYAMTQEQMLACSHGDIRHGFVLEFNEHQPDIDIPTLEARVNELIRQDLPIDYYDESHILLGGAQHYCTGPRTHVRSTGRIIGFRLLDHFIYDHFHKTYMLVGCVGDDSEENIRKLETIHG